MDTFENQILQLKGHILMAAFEEGGVVFDLKNRSSSEINQTGVMLFKLLDGKKVNKAIIRTFARSYGQPEEMVKKDAIHFLTNLVEREWVVVVNSRK